MLGQKTCVTKFKKSKITSSIFSNHNDMKLVINNKRKPGKCINLKITQQTPEKQMDQKSNQRKNKN